MKIAILCSEKVNADLKDYLDIKKSELIFSDGVGFNKSIKEFADKYNVPQIMIRPEYELYGNFAKFEANKIIVKCADFILFFWDGITLDIKYAINYAKSLNKDIKIVYCR